MNRRETAEKASHKPTVLMIDDDVEEQQFLVDAFKEVSPDYSVVCLDNGKKALSYLQRLQEEELPCLIILDYDMPEWNGADVLIRLRQLPQLKDTPVVFHSNSSQSHLDDTYDITAVIPKANSWNGMKENIQFFVFYSQQIVVL